MDKLPADLKAKATSIANGETTTVGAVAIEAIPAYNTTEDRKKYHPQGRDNGYVLTVDGRRVYIAGDTEDIPEMRALKDIVLAFVPMNLPYTMRRAGRLRRRRIQSGVGLSLPLRRERHPGLRPARGESGAGTEVVLRDWYPAS